MTFPKIDVQNDAACPLPSNRLGVRSFSHWASLTQSTQRKFKWWNKVNGVLDCNQVFCDWSSGLAIRVCVRCFVKTVWSTTWEYALTSAVKVFGLFCRFNCHHQDRWIWYTRFEAASDIWLDSLWFRMVLQVVNNTKRSAAVESTCAPGA